MIYSLRITDQAQHAIDDAYVWLFQHSPDGARRWHERLDQLILAIWQDPNRYAIADESQQFDVELRQAFFRTRRGHRYRILFWIEGSVIHLVAMRGPGQRPVSPADFEVAE